MGNWFGGDDALGGVVNRLKSASARCANKALRRDGPLWSRAFHDHGPRAEEDLRRSAQYVVANSVRAGLVKRIGGYPFWNAAWV